jgi:hypothetical protein
VRDHSSAGGGAHQRERGAERRPPHGQPGSGHARLRSLLVVAELAVALVLLTASGLLLRSFEKVRTVDLGLRTDHMLTAHYSLPRQQYGAQGRH